MLFNAIFKYASIRRMAHHAANLRVSCHFPRCTHVQCMPTHSVELRRSWRLNRTHARRTNSPTEPDRKLSTVNPHGPKKSFIYNATPTDSDL